MSDVGEKLHLGAQEGADAGDVDSALMWRPHNTEVRDRQWSQQPCYGFRSGLELFWTCRIRGDLSGSETGSDFLTQIFVQFKLFYTLKRQDYIHIFPCKD
jgi:hypothetical protein